MVLPILAVLPQRHIAFALGDDDDRARPVAVKCTAATGREFGDVATVGGIGKSKAHVLDAFAFHGKIVERKLIDVRNQIGFPIAVRHMLVVTQELIAGVETIPKIKRIAKDKILVVKNIDHARTGRADEQAHRLIPRTVEMDVARVQRDREDRAGSPLERDLGAVILRYRRGAAAFDDINDLFKKMALRQGLATGGNLTNIDVRLLLVR